MKKATKKRMIDKLAEVKKAQKEHEAKLVELDIAINEVRRNIKACKEEYGKTEAIIKFIEEEEN